MLKIYKMKITYEVQNESKTVQLRSCFSYVIEEEQNAMSKCREVSAYDALAARLYDGVIVYERKKGKMVECLGPSSTVFLKQWKAPNAKLIAYLTYEEAQCSMKQLLDMDADKVIAYLKQEGLTNCKYML